MIEKKLSALDKINAKLISRHLKRDVTKIVANTLDVPDIQQIMTAQVKEYLEIIKKQKGITGYSVDAHVTHHTWTSLYPSLKKRIAAFLFYKVTGRCSYDKQRWFHTVFPFNVQYRVRNFWESWEYEGVFDGQYDEDGEIMLSSVEKYERLEGAIQEFNKNNTPQYVASFAVPHDTMDVDMVIQPVTPVEYISLNVSITKEGCTLN